MSKRYSKLDERGNRIVRQVSSIMYIVTLYSLIGIQLYRQFVLNQPSEEWTDIAILISINAIVWVGSLLYLSGIVNPRVVRMRYLIAGFTGFVILGLAFTIFKYSVLLEQTVSMLQLLDMFFTVLKISAILIGFWGLLAYLGHKRIEKRIS
ncbi:MAG: hypothetical protein E4G99_06175 [Anaerolineales bacterium]|nr:MAG: hypothetical protein E4G99_06175 [Anaerolineales bacterium]